MDKVLYLSASAAREITQAQTVHSNNLANASTGGFKADFAQARAMQVYGDGHPGRVHAATESPGTNLAPGSLDRTGRDLDVAIDGEGWLAVLRPDGTEAYTRYGSLQVDPAGQLRTSRGDPVLGEGGPIALPPFENVLIGDDGTVTVQPQGQEANNLVQIDRLKVVRPDSNTLVKGPDGLFSQSDGLAAPPAGEVSVQSGALENSNVNVVQEMTEILGLSREFEVQLRLMQTAKQNDEAAAKLLSIS
ncbi:MAG: flagellar basal-body rod protein FlgF [Pseudomonadota bacterium]